MDRQRDPGTIANAIIDSNLYMTLGTADETGRPWVSPVYYTPEGYSRFYWVSSPEATHSRNVRASPEVSIVIFDSRTPVGSGQGVYVSAVAQELAGDDLVDDALAGLGKQREEVEAALTEARNRGMAWRP